jgi:beta-galactosidase beta subunit
MTDEEILRAYNERVDQIIKAIFQVDEESIQNARNELDQTRLFIIGKVAEGGTAAFNPHAHGADQRFD